MDVTQLDEQIAELEAKMHGQAEGTTDKPGEHGQAFQGKEVSEADTNAEVRQEEQPTSKEDVIVDTKSSNSVQQEDAAFWKNRFSTTKANLDITIHDLRVTIKDLEQKLAEQNTLRFQSEKKVRDLLRSVEEEETYGPLLDKKVVSIIGEDTAATLQNTISSAIDSRVKPLQDELERKNANESKRMEDEKAGLAKKQKMVFTKNLGIILSKYKIVLHEMNDDPGFIEWLSGTNELGEVRQSLLNSAAASRDAERVSQFFIEYAASTVSQLDDEITPLSASGGSVSGTESGDKGKRTQFSYKEVEEYYNNGYKALSHAEQIAQEAIYDKALASGNIV